MARCTSFAHLRGSGQLTAGLLLRGLLCGNKHLHVAALCELTEVPMARMADVVAASKSAGFAALYRKAQMPERLLPALYRGPGGGSEIPSRQIDGHAAAAAYCHLRS